jgi:hypothetical protein
MKYEIIRMDGRFTYRNLFEYAIKFSNRMAVDHGPLQFNDALKWFFDTYGWSAEIRDYSKMQKWVTVFPGIKTQPFRIAQSILTEIPVHCNPHWSWTNGYDDLRIYVATDAELNFFQLRWPNERRSLS